jgi:hypothetical protein
MHLLDAIAIGSWDILPETIIHKKIAFPHPRQKFHGRK